MGLSFFVSQASHANVVGNDFQNFNPTYNGLDFITVHSSETLEPCVLNLGAYYNQAYNSLPFFESVDFNVDEFRNRRSYSDVIGGFDFNAGYGVKKNWDLGINIQSLIYQKIESDELISGSFEERGLSEIRLNTKYRFSGDNQGGAAFVASVNVNMVQNNIFLGSKAGPTFNFEFVYDHTWNRVNWGLNLGYRLRQEGKVIQAGVTPLGDAFIYSTALSYLLSDADLKLVWELYGSYPYNDKSFTSNRARSNLETLLGLKYDRNSNLSFLGGFGTEVQSGTSTPDWRFFLGLNYAFDCCEAPAAKEADKPLPPPPPIEIEPTVEAETETIEIPEVPEPVPDEEFVLSDINFRFNSFNKVYEKSIAVLDKLAEYLQKKKFQKLVIIGHTDSVGPAPYNLELSRLRSQAIVQHLIKVDGLPRSRVFYKYFGETRPVADNGNYQGRRKNRRVEFQVFY